MVKAVNNQKEIKLGEILYLCFFGALLFAKGIGLYDGQFIFKLVLIFATGCLVLKFVVEEYTWAEILKVIVVLGISGTAYLISGEKGLFLYGLMMVGLKYVNMRRIFMVGAALWTIAFLGITITSLFHMQDTVYRVDEKLGLGPIFRWSLGYPHPNVLQISYLVLAIFIFYLLGHKFRIKHAILLFAGNCLIFMYSVSYTGFIVFMCLLMGRLYLYFRKKLNIVEKLILQLIIPVCIWFSLVAPIAITGRTFNKLNQMLNTRMELGYRFLQPEFRSLFGVRLSDITTEVLTMDNSYLSAFVTYGAIPFVLICLATMYMLYKCLRKDKYLEALIILTIAIGGLTEPFLYNTSFKNLEFLFMGQLLIFNTAKESNGKKVALFTRLNKTIRMKQIKLSFICPGKAHYLCGIVTALLVGIVVSMTAKAPQGYVVYRTDCSDLTKETHAYEENVEEYENFKEMADFQEGDLIEYFSGNIVKMEQVRSILSSLLIGFGLGLAGAVLVEMIRNKKSQAGRPQEQE